MATRMIFAIHRSEFVPISVESATDQEIQDYLHPGPNARTRPSQFKVARD
jgi:hypothetical protein